MKNSRLFFLLLVLMVLILLPGCEKKGDMYLRGNIVGFVKLFDESGNDLSDKSGVTVKIESTSFSTETNMEGRYELSGIPAGTYIMVYDKEGFGTFKRYNFQFVGGNVPALCMQTKLFQQPTTEIQNMTVSFADEKLTISGAITQTNQYDMLFIIGDDPDVSNLVHDDSYEYGFCCYPSVQFDLTWYVNYRPFVKGESLYFVVYMKNYSDNSGYEDYENGGFYYTSIKKASEVIKLVME